MHGTHHLLLQNSHEVLVHLVRQSSLPAIPVAVDPAAFDIFEKSKWDPASKFFIRHAEIYQAILHDVVEDMPVIHIRHFAVLRGDFL